MHFSFHFLLFICFFSIIYCGSYNDYNHDDIDSNNIDGTDLNNDIIDHSLIEQDLKEYNILDNDILEHNIIDHNLINHNKDNIIDIDTKDKNEYYFILLQLLFVGILSFSVFYFLGTTKIPTQPIKQDKNMVNEEDIEDIENDINIDIKNEEKNEKIEDTIKLNYYKDSTPDNQIISNKDAEKTLIINNNNETKEETIARNTDMSLQRLIVQYEEKRLIGGLTMKEETKLLKLQIQYENIVLLRETTKERRFQTSVLEDLARNSAEANTLKRTRILFDYFQKWESFIRYWSVCILLCTWGLCKLRQFAPKTNIDFINIDNYLPWYFPRVLIPNFSYIGPIVIVLSLIFVIFLIFVTQGNSLASMLIFIVIALVFFWTVDSLTLSVYLFSILRVVIITLIFCVISTILFEIPKFFLKKYSFLLSIWIYMFTLTSIICSLYIGFYISLTDYPNLQTNIEYWGLTKLDEFIEQLTE